MTHETPAISDVFEYEVGGFSKSQKKLGPQRWIFVDPERPTHVSEQGQEIAELRSICGGHKASVNMDWLRTGEARFDAWEDPDDGVMHPARVVKRPVKLVVKGGAAAAREKFEKHQDHWLDARFAFDKALAAHASGANVDAAKFEEQAREHLDLMDGVRDLKLGHVAKKMLAEYERQRDAASAK